MVPTEHIIFLKHWVLAVLSSIMITNLDLFLVNSGSIHSTIANTPYKNVLYRNNRDGTFTDVTEQSNLDTLSGYNHGVVAADYDNDSDQDLYITSLGANHLYRTTGTVPSQTQLSYQA